MTKQNRPYTKFKHINEVNLDDKTARRLFMYDVEDGFYPDDFFLIENINPNSPEELNHWLNVVDITDKLVSRFAVAPRMFNGAEIAPRSKQYQARYIVKDSNNKKVVETEFIGEDGFPVRQYKTDNIRPGVAMATFVPIKSDIPNQKFVTSFLNPQTMEARKFRGDSVMKRDVYLGNINPTSSHYLKTQIRNEAKDDKKDTVIELASIKLKALQREELDNEGNVIKPMIPAVWRDDVRIIYNAQKRRIELDANAYEYLKESAIYAGASPANGTTTALLEIKAYLEGLGDNPASQDIAKKIVENTRHLVKSRNTTKIINEEGEVVSKEGKKVPKK